MELYETAPELALSISRDLAQALLTSGTEGAPAATGEVAGASGSSFERSATVERSSHPISAAPSEAPAAPALDPFRLAPSLESGPSPAAEDEAGRRLEVDPVEATEEAKIGPFYQEQVACPICAEKIDAVRVRSRALRPVRRESDLRTIYKGVNPLHYAVSVCPTCWYAAYNDDWEALDDTEQATLSADTDNRRQAALGLTLGGERDLSMVAASYLLALRCYDFREADPRRRAGLLHRLAWTAREAGEPERERQYLEIAQQDYARAFESDDGLTDSGAVMLAYLWGDLALRLGDPKEAIRWFERTRRMEAAKARPEIVRLTRDRWADARALMQESA